MVAAILENDASTLTLPSGMVKVYLPSFLVSFTSSPFLSVTVMLSRMYPLSGSAVRVTVVPLDALLRFALTSPFSASSTLMA